MFLIEIIVKTAKLFYGGNYIGTHLSVHSDVNFPDFLTAVVRLTLEAANEVSTVLSELESIS